MLVGITVFGFAVLTHLDGGEPGRVETLANGPSRQRIGVKDAIQDILFGVGAVAEGKPGALGPISRDVVAKFGIATVGLQEWDLPIRQAMPGHRYAPHI